MVTQYTKTDSGVYVFCFSTTKDSVKTDQESILLLTGSVESLFEFSKTTRANVGALQINLFKSFTVC